MANTDKNIVITPNIGSSTDYSKIVFSGADASTSAQNITARVYPTNGGTLSFEGSTGQLMSIANTMSGTIFAANDISGIPSIEVLDTGLVKLAQYNGSVTIFTGSAQSNAVLTANGGIYSTALGVGTAPSTTTGEIRATGNITAYYSDDRLKTKLGVIENALDKICSLEGFYYEANETAQALGYEPVREVGISAQATQKVLPEIVAPAPIDEKYLTVRYERLAPLLIEAIKELREENKLLREEIKTLK